MKIESFNIRHQSIILISHFTPKQIKVSIIDICFVCLASYLILWLSNLLFWGNDLSSIPINHRTHIPGHGDGPTTCQADQWECSPETFRIRSMEIGEILPVDLSAAVAISPAMGRNPGEWSQYTEEKRQGESPASFVSVKYSSPTLLLIWLDDPVYYSLSQANRFLSFLAKSWANTEADIKGFCLVGFECLKYYP